MYGIIVNSKYSERKENMHINSYGTYLRRIILCLVRYSMFRFCKDVPGPVYGYIARDKKVQNSPQF